MNSTIINRRFLLQGDPYTIDTTFSPRDPISPTTINGTTSIAGMKRPFKPTASFDSYMALTVIVLLAALFFMGFFSIYIRRFTAEDPPSSSSSDNYMNRNPPPPTSDEKGLDPSALKSLPLVAGKHRNIEDCPICLSEFEEKEMVKLIPYCRHVFHPICIDTWLSCHLTCPVCRSSQLFERAEEVCLDVMQERVEIGGSEIAERSTVVNSDTCRDGRLVCAEDM